VTYQPPASGQPAPQQYAPPVPLNPSDQRLWATLIHLGGIVFGVLPSLIGFLVLKDRGLFVRDHTRSALNFQITMIILQVAAAIVTMIGSFLLIVLIGIPILIIGLVAALGGAVLVIVYSIMAAIAANKGELYTYPAWCAIPFVH